MLKLPLMEAEAVKLDNGCAGSWMHSCW